MGSRSAHYAYPVAALFYYFYRSPLFGLTAPIRPKTRTSSRLPQMGIIR